MADVTTLTGLPATRQAEGFRALGIWGSGFRV